MKKKIMKFLAIQNILIILFLMIAGILMFTTTETIAKSVNFDKDGKTLLLENDYFKIYADDNVVRYGIIQVYRGKTYYIDEGAALYIVPKKEYYAFEVDTYANQEIKYISNNEYKIIIDSSFPDEFQLLGRCRKDVNAAYMGDNLMNVIIRRNAYTFNQNQSSDVVYYNGIIYAKPGARVYLNTEWDSANGDYRRKGHYYVNGKSDGKEYVTAPNSLGASKEVTWANMFGASLPAQTIVASNLITDTTNAYRIEISNYGRGSVSSITENVNGYYTNKEIGLCSGQNEYYLNIYMGNKFTGKGVYIDSTIQLSSVQGSNVIIGEPSYSYSNNYCSLRFKLNQNIFSGNGGVVEFAYNDYTGRRHVNYWHIDNYNNSSMKVVEQEDLDIPTFIDEGTTILPINNNVPISYTPYEDNQVVESEKSRVRIHPGHDVTWWREFNSYEFDAVAPDADELYWVLAKSPAPTINVDYGLYGMIDGHFSVDIDSPYLNEGSYDVLLYKSKNGYYFYDYITTLYIGGKNVVRNPIITQSKSGTINQNTGIASYEYTVEDATEVKYKVIKRDDPNVQSEVPEYYDNFDGQIATDPSKIEIKINPLETGSGTYDIIVYAINRSAENEYINLYTPLITSGIKCYIAPTISTQLEMNTLEDKEYSISASCLDNCNITESKYAIVKKQKYDEVTNLTADQIKNPSEDCNIVEYGDFKNDDKIKINIEKFGEGFFDLILYAKNSLGAEKFVKISSIMVTKGINLNYRILNESEDQLGSMSLRYVQNVDFIATDELFSEYDYTYFVSENDYTANYNGELISEIFYDENIKEEKITQRVKKGENFRITLNAEKGKRKDVYIYAMVKPADIDGASTCCIRTGSIRLDGSDLEVNAIYVQGDQHKKIFKSGEEINIVVEFNHEIEDVSEHFFPYLLLDVGGQELKSSNVTCEDNKVIYYFKVEEDTPSGCIKIDKLIYNFDDDGFYGKDTEEYFCNNTLENKNQIFDFVSEDFFIDTVSPKLENIEIQINGEVIDGVDQDGKNVKYIKDFDSVKLIGNYTEEIIGDKTTISVKKGNKTALQVGSNNTANRTEDEFDLTEKLKQSPYTEFEGELELINYGDENDEIFDLAGNKIDYSYIPQVTYILNGNKIENQTLIFDSTVIKPELYVGNTRMNDSGVYNTGLTYKCFAEFNSADNYHDISGLTDTVELAITFEGKIAVPVYDKNGDEAVCRFGIYKTDQEGVNVVKYYLNQELLPVTFKFDDEGTHKITATKTDKIGNESKIEYVIEAKDHISVSEKDSGLLNLNNNKMYCLEDVEEKDKAYTITLKSENIDFENVKVFVEHNAKKTDECIKLDSYTENSMNYGKYSFTVSRTGKYRIYAVDVDDNVVFNGFVEAPNVYKIGDTNYDGLIDSGDVIQILKYIAKMGEVKDDKVIPYAGNVNGSIFNGKPELDVSDAVYLVRLIAEDPTVILRDSDKDIHYDE